MIVIHIDSGLGNQMFAYCGYLAVKYANPQKEIYIEDILYSVPDCTNRICMWNGYELNNVFGIDERNIKSVFEEEIWEDIVEEVNKSKFWESGWEYQIPILNALGRNGIELVFKSKKIHSNRNEISRNARFIYYIKRLASASGLLKRERFGAENHLFASYDSDVFLGSFLQFMYLGSGIEKIEDEIRKSFKFKAHDIKENIEIEKYIKATNSVAVHVRRGDFLVQNERYYNNGYFDRAINFIKRQVNNPVFFLFCDRDTKKWVKDNLTRLGLRIEDEVIIVDWNDGINSYRDMQLMASCKHNVITNSSFGWWGAFLNSNPGKITCSPHPSINSTHWF